MATPTEKQFAAFIDRILRLKEEQDEIGAQVRDVYLEMKGVGYDKTAAGALVTELRKRDKNGAKFEEASAVLELYRLSYENAKSSHTHAHARETAITNPAGSAARGQAALSGECPEAPLSDAISNEPAGTAATNPDQQPPSSQVVDETGAGVPPATAPVSPIPLIRKTAKDYRPHCLNPDVCAASGLDHCYRCRKAMETEAA